MPVPSRFVGKCLFQSCPPHELNEILELEKFNVILLEEIARNTLTDWRLDLRGERANSGFGARVSLPAASSDHWVGPLPATCGMGCPTNENSSCLYHFLTEEKISFDCLLSMLVAFSEDFDSRRFPSFAYTVAGSKMTYTLAPCLTEVVVHALSKLQVEHGIRS